VITLIHDRGLKKWHAALLLPEHVKLHREWQNEMNYQKKPELDEQKFEEMDQLILEAMEYNLPINITYFSDHQQQVISGHLHLYDSLKNELRMVTLTGSPLTLKLSMLLDIQRYQEE
jgi:YolD-like protein